MWSSPDGWMPLKTRGEWPCHRAKVDDAAGTSQAMRTDVVSKAPTASRPAPARPAKTRPASRPRAKAMVDPSQLLAIAVEAAADLGGGPKRTRARPRTAPLGGEGAFATS